MNGMSERSNARRHKWSRTQAPCAEWRKRLLQNCVARVKAEREETVSSARARRLAILAEEASHLRNAGNRALELSSDEINTLVADLEEAITKERRAAEEAAIREHRQSLAETDADLRELVAFHTRFEGVSTSSAVFCPLCTRDVLQVRHGVLFCSCGLRLDGGTYDNLTLDVVRARLAQVLDEHSKRICCQKGAPSFSCHERFGFTFMHARCDSCRMDSIVL